MDGCKAHPFDISRTLNASQANLDICLVVPSDLLFFFFLGVYFTSIDPYHDPKSILLNNYDDAGRVINIETLWAKIEWVIKVYLPNDKVVKVEGFNRDVYLFQGNVDLGKYQYQIYNNPTLSDTI